MAKKKQATGTAAALEREGLVGRGFEAETTGPGNDLPEAPWYVIQVPNKGYMGVTGWAGKMVGFQNGEGRTDDRELAWMLREDFGYTVIPQNPEQKVAAGDSA